MSWLRGLVVAEALWCYTSGDFPSVRLQLTTLEHSRPERYEPTPARGRSLCDAA